MHYHSEHYIRRGCWLCVCMHSSSHTMRAVIASWVPAPPPVSPLAVLPPSALYTISNISWSCPNGAPHRGSEEEASLMTVAILLHYHC